MQFDRLFKIANKRWNFLFQSKEKNAVEERLSCLLQAQDLGGF